MHDSAFRIGELVMQTYCDLPGAKILEIGSMDVNGSLRDFAEPTTQYIGVDLEKGPSVDVVVKPGEKLPFDDFSFDLIMASSAFEHDPRFWETFIEMCRVARPGGHIYVNAPSNGGVHRYPLDCWRFYPDAGLALVQYAKDRQVEVELVESFVGKRYTDTWDGWNDFVAIFRRGPSKAPLNKNFIYRRYPSYNARTWNSSEMDFETPLTEDMQLGRDLRQQVAEQHASVEKIQNELVSSENIREKLTTDLRTSESELSQVRGTAAGLREQVQTLSSALQAQADTFARLERERVELGTLNDKLNADLRISQSEVSQLRSASVSLEQQVQTLSSSLQAQTDAFARVQDRDLAVISALEADLSRLRADHASHVEQASAEIARFSARETQASAEIARFRARETELETALKHASAESDRNRKAIQWLRALHIAMAGRPAWWSLLPARSRREREYAMLRNLGLFDERSYLARYNDVAAQGADPLDHYVTHGMYEDRERG